MTDGYAPIAEITTGRNGPLEEAEELKKPLGDQHRVVVRYPDDRVFIEETAAAGPRWLRIATIDSGYSDPEAAQALADSLGDFDYRVVWCYCTDEGYLEVETGE